MPVVPFAARPQEAAPEVDQSFTAMATAEIHKAGWFGDLFGTGTKTDMTNAKAPALEHYPTDADAKTAIDNQFGYGKGNEDYIRGEHAQVLGMTDKKGNFSPLSRADIGSDATFSGMADQNVDMTKFKNIDTLNKVNTTMTRAALAVNRNPVAAMGFDPRRTILDIATGQANLAGSYNAVARREGGGVTPQSDDVPVDKIWSNLPDSRADEASSVVHESIHRGIEKIRLSREGDTLLKSMGVADRGSNAEEMLTRYMMVKYAGDPEGHIASKTEDIKQRQQGLDFVEKLNPGMAEKVDRLMELAANQLKNRRPRGPN
jgi:hypothetical protein